MPDKAKKPEHIGVATTRTTTVQHSVRLGATDIFDLLRGAGVLVPDPLLACDLRITMRVPGGGDWSNMNLDISAANPVVVEWTVTEEKIDVR